MKRHILNGLNWRLTTKAIIEFFYSSQSACLPHCPCQFDPPVIPCECRNPVVRPSKPNHFRSHEAASKCAAVCVICPLPSSATPSWKAYCRLRWAYACPLVWLHSFRVQVAPDGIPEMLRRPAISLSAASNCVGN